MHGGLLRNVNCVAQQPGMAFKVALGSNNASFQCSEDGSSNVSAVLGFATAGAANFALDVDCGAGVRMACSPALTVDVDTSIAWRIQGDVVAHATRHGMAAATASTPMTRIEGAAAIAASVGCYACGDDGNGAPTRAACSASELSAVFPLSLHGEPSNGAVFADPSALAALALQACGEVYSALQSLGARVAELESRV
jgi:hypothetical protein